MECGRFPAEHTTKRGEMANTSSRKRHTRRSAAARTRSLHARYPLYVPAQPGEAEAELGPQRAAELLAHYNTGTSSPSHTLRKADVALEKVLRWGTFTVVSAEYPEGRQWTVEEYRQRHNAAHEHYEDFEETRINDAAGMVQWLHDMHDMGLYFLDRDQALRAEDIGQEII